jgi:tryptophanyl-tRNA synthetase
MRYLSGIQPSGQLHLGNYFGAIREHILSQNPKNEGFFFIANYHALTTEKNPQKIRQYTREVAATYLALGLNPKESVLFLQSDVPQVHELAWYLSCVFPVSRLELQPSYKDKIAKGLSPFHGLFAYPILMAADILIYDSECVPVGKDQLPHIDLARDVAQRFNTTFSAELLKIPSAQVREEVAVVPGIDGEKMSKSYGNDIAIFLEGKALKKRVMSIVTDSTPVEAPKNPEKCTVFQLYKLFATPEELSALAERYRAGGMGYGEAKTILWEKIEAYFEPYREPYHQFLTDESYLMDILKEGAKKARGVADQVLERVRRKIGILRTL